MAKQQILLVDSDASSARLLEVSLRSAGFTVATADSAEEALAKLEHGTPDLILTDTALPKADGFSFVRKLRARAETAEVPVVFLTEQGALEDKLRGLELGVDDYLAKPIFVREVVTRVQLLLARKRQRIAPEPARTRFSGSLEDVAVVDLLQTIAVSGKSGVASVRRGDREAWLYFDRGQVIDAEVGDLRGEEAVYRTISWTTGSFDLEFRACDRPKVIDAPYQALLMEGLRRVDELGRIAEQLPPEDSVIDLDHAALASRLNEIPDELNAILRLIDGKRTLLDLIDASPFDDLSTLTVLSKFYFEGLISSNEPTLAEGSERPAALPQTAPPSTVPAEVAPPREARRQTPAPITARAPGGASEGKLTPKGIVNVGEHGTTPPRGVSSAAAQSLPAQASSAAPLPAQASPFRVVSEQRRRSPIPMPDESLRINAGARDHGALQASGEEAEALRQTRTSLGLSAAPLRRPSITAELPAPPAAGAEREASPPAVMAKPALAEAPVVTEAPVAPAVMARPAVTAAPAVTAEAHPSSEQEFFEAGDEGTYEGGPLSEVPELRLDRESEAPAAPPPKRASPVRAERARRGKVIVAGVLAVASVPLLIGVGRLAFRAPVAPVVEPAVSPAVSPGEAPAVVEPAAPRAAPAATTAPPAGAAPVVQAPVVQAPVVQAPSAPAAASGLAPRPSVAARPSPPPVAQPAASAAARAAPTAPAAARAAPAAAPREVAPPAPARATPKPPPRAAKPADAPAPAAPARPAVLPPLDIPTVPRLPKAGEKPPTAAYPLR